MYNIHIDNFIGGSVEKLNAISVELHRLADMQFDGIKECFERMKQVLGHQMTDDEILDKLAVTMQQVTGITYDTIKRQIAETKVKIDSMEKAILEEANV